MVRTDAHELRPVAAEIILSQPGLGPILGARVLAEFGDDPYRYASAKARRTTQAPRRSPAPSARSRREPAKELPRLPARRPSFPGWLLLPGWPPSGDWPPSWDWPRCRGWPGLRAGRAGWAWPGIP